MQKYLGLISVNFTKRTDWIYSSEGAFPTFILTDLQPTNMI